METIWTKNNGPIYQMREEECNAIVNAYAQIHCNGQLAVALTQMHLRQILNELPIEQAVAIRQHKRRYPEQWAELVA
jgi:hypothetical protein